MDRLPRIREDRVRGWPWLIPFVSSVVVLASLPRAVRVYRVTPPEFVAFIDATVAVTVPWVGALIMSRTLRHRVGWVLLSQASLALAFGADSWAFSGPTIAPLPGAVWAAWISSFAWVPFLALPTLLVLWFPTGRVPTKRWRPLEALIVGALAALLVLSMLDPATGHHVVTNPVWSGAPRWVPDVRDVMTAMVGVAGTLLAVVSALLRWRRAIGEQRQQLTWFAASLPLFVACFMAPLPFPLKDIVGGLGFAIMGGAIAVAVLRYRLYDLDLVVNRAVVYTVSTVIIGAIYLAVVIALSRLLGREVELVIATFVVAVAFAPVRGRVQHLADHLLFGDRSDPYVAFARLNRRLETADRPDAMLDAAADDIRLALRVPYVQLHGTNGTLAQAGQQPKWNDVDERTLIHRSAEVGRLVVSLRRPGVPFDEREHRLLDDLGRQLGAALHGVRLADDLQRSREQLVIAREQERQRLHRDLHDGLGPSLGAAVLSLDAIRKSLPEGTPKTAAMIDAMKAGLRESVADVRRVIYELRPPALDELGLVGAIARQATALGHHGNMKLELIAPNDLPRLEPALEVAAYRLTSEALNNAVRHSHANHVTVDITLNGALRIAVTDDGIGMQPDSVAGIGLSSMRQRAEELGGTFSITSTHGLTTVNAEFPADRLRPDAP